MDMVNRPYFPRHLKSLKLRSIRRCYEQAATLHGRIQTGSRQAGNCHDNTVAESFFQLLKRERIRRKTYADREEAQQDMFDYIEMFYNPKRRHSFNNGLSPVKCEKQYFEQLESV